MPSFLSKPRTTPTARRGCRAQAGAAAPEAVADMAKAAGGSLESFHFGFGDADAYVIVDLPGNEAAAAVALAVNAAGLASTKTTVLLTPEEVDAAAKQSVDYRPPGS